MTGQPHSFGFLVRQFFLVRMPGEEECLTSWLGKKLTWAKERGQTEFHILLQVNTSNDLNPTFQGHITLDMHHTGDLVFDIWYSREHLSPKEQPPPEFALHAHCLHHCICSSREHSVSNSTSSCIMIILAFSWQETCSSPLSVFKVHFLLVLFTIILWPHQ